MHDENPHKESLDSILQDLSFNQHNLEVISQKPSLAPYELNAVNTFYGNGEHVRRYASLPADEPLPFSIEHFVPLSYESPMDYDLKAGLPTFLAAHGKRSEAYNKNGAYSVTFGSGIHYAIHRLLQDKSWKKPEKKCGTIAFPHKSTAELNRSFNYDAFADWLLALPEEYQPVVVCISWRDYLENKHLAYIERGIPVVGCGHHLDPDFLFRFIDLCFRFKYSCGNAIGSSYPFSVLCGCHFFYQDFGGVREKENDDTIRHLPTPGATSELGAELKDLAPFPPEPSLLEKQRKLVGFITGEEHVHTPTKIRELFDWSRHQLLNQQGTKYKCTPTSELSIFNTWLPNRIHSDGWVETNGRIILKPSTLARTIEAYLEFPSWLIDETQSIQIMIEDSPPIEFDCAPAYYKITLPIDASNQKIVRFKSNLETSLSDEDHRLVSFRILGWEVSNHHTISPECIPIYHEKLPQFIRED